MPKPPPPPYVAGTVRSPVYIAGPLALTDDALHDARALALARLAVTEGKAPVTVAAHQGMLLGPATGPDNRGREAVLHNLVRSGAFLVGNNVLGELWLLEDDDGDVGAIGRAALYGFEQAGRGRVSRRGTWAELATAFGSSADMRALHAALVKP